VIGSSRLSAHRFSPPCDGDGTMALGVCGTHRSSLLMAEHRMPYRRLFWRWQA